MHSKARRIDNMRNDDHSIKLIAERFKSNLQDNIITDNEARLKANIAEDKIFITISRGSFSEVDIESIKNNVFNIIKIYSTKYKRARGMANYILGYLDWLANIFSNIGKSLEATGEQQLAAKLYYMISDIYKEGASSVKFKADSKAVDSIKLPSLYWRYYADNVYMQKPKRSVFYPTKLAKRRTTTQESKRVEFEINSRNYENDLDVPHSRTTPQYQDINKDTRNENYYALVKDESEYTGYHRIFFDNTPESPKLFFAEKPYIHKSPETFSPKLDVDVSTFAMLNSDFYSIDLDFTSKQRQVESKFAVAAEGCLPLDERFHLVSFVADQEGDSKS